MTRRYKRRTLNNILKALRPIRGGLTTNAIADDPQVGINWMTANRYLNFLKSKGYVAKVKYKHNSYTHWVHYKHVKKLRRK